MPLSKQQFLAKPKLKALPAAEKERRWKQHLMSEGGIRDKRIEQRVQGRGDYFSSAKAWLDRQTKRIPRGTFGKMGSAIAGAPGQAAGDLIAHLTGRGDYNIRKNSLIQDGNVLRPSQMSFASSGSASIRMRRREFIGDVIAPSDPTAFTQNQYRLQPTDGKTFPWLATVANHFSEYVFHGAIITYETTSSNYAQDMALGTISMATQYNANELPYSDMREILQAAYHSRGNPSENVMHGIECDPALQASEHLFTRRFGTSGPPNLYDHGVVTVATEGLPAKSGTVLGRLFITYDVELNLPVLPTGDRSTGKSLTLWTSTSSTTAPPMGDPLTVTAYTTPMMLSFGPTAGSNIMALLPSNGPWARPNVPVEHQSALVGWISDSSVASGVQYVSFANVGTYVIEITCLAATNTSGNPGDIASGMALTPHAVLEKYHSTFNHSLFPNTQQTYVRFVCVCNAPDQSFSLIRLNNTDIGSWTVITVCSDGK